MTTPTRLKQVCSIIPDDWMLSICNDDTEICVTPPSRAKTESVIVWKTFWSSALKIVEQNLRAEGLTVRTDGSSIWVRV